MRDRIISVDLDIKKFKAVPYKQYDKNNVLRVVITKNGKIINIQNCNAIVNFKMPSGKTYEASSTIEDNSVKIILTEKILEEYGKVIVEIEFSDDKQKTTTFSVFLNIEKSITEEEIEKDDDVNEDIQDGNLIAKHTHQNMYVLNQITQDMIDTINNLEESIDLSNYYTKEELDNKNYLTEHQDISHLISKEELDNRNYATESYVKNEIQNAQFNNDNINIDISHLATKEELNNKADIEDIPIKVSELENDKNYATENYVKNEIANAQLGGGGGEINLSGYATKDDLNSKADKSSIPTKTSQLINDSNYLTNIPNEYITEEELNKKGYLTEHQDISGKADKTELFSKDYNDLINKPNIPSLEGFATEEFVTNKIAEAELGGENNEIDLSGYATKNELNNKADKSSIPTKVSQLENDNNYLTNIPNEYITETELEGKNYLTEHQDISHLANKSELHSHNNKSILDGITSDKINIWDNKSDFNGSYNNLVDKPTIPTKTSQLINDSNYLTNIPNEYITESELNDKGYLTEHQDISHLANKSELFSGNYEDLTNKPSIPNLEGYVTKEELNEDIQSGDIIKNNSITMDKLNEEIQLILESTNKGLITAQNTYILEVDTNEIEIGINGFNKDIDTLFVFKNSTHIIEGIEYNINGNSTKLIKIDDNWTKGDAFVFIALSHVEKSEELNNIDLSGLVAKEDLSEYATKEELNSIDLSEYATKEELNSIGDTNELMTSDKSNIVNAINEVFQSANNGKQLIADAIGNELITVDSTFSAMSEAILGYENNLRIILTDEGVSVSEEDNIDSLITKVDEEFDNKNEEITAKEEEIANSGGLDIISATELPATGKENQICVITDKPQENITVIYNSAYTGDTDEIVVYLRDDSSDSSVVLPMLTLDYGNTTVIYYFDYILQNNIGLKGYVYREGKWTLLIPACDVYLRNYNSNKSWNKGHNTYALYTEGCGIHLRTTTSSGYAYLTSADLINFSMYNKVRIKYFFTLGSASNTFYISFGGKDTAGGGISTSSVLSVKVTETNGESGTGIAYKSSKIKEVELSLPTDYSGYYLCLQLETSPTSACCAIITDVIFIKK